MKRGRKSSSSFIWPTTTSKPTSKPAYPPLSRQPGSIYSEWAWSVVLKGRPKYRDISKKSNCFMTQKETDMEEEDKLRLQEESSRQSTESQGKVCHQRASLLDAGYWGLQPGGAEGHAQEEPFYDVVTSLLLSINWYESTLSPHSITVRSNISLVVPTP